MYENTKPGLVKVYEDKGWPGASVTVAFGRRRRDGLSFAGGIGIAAIIGSRYPMVAFLDAMIDEAADLIISSF